jgi:hypothetical protein
MLVLMVMAPTCASMKVWPSAGLRCTSCMPILPLAPGRLSTTTGWPSNSASRGAMMRA